ncbi:MAG: RCC1 domain-containing protein [Candidatus Competibacterales bacterium]
MKSSDLYWFLARGGLLGLLMALAPLSCAQDDVITASPGGHSCALQGDGSVRCWGNDEFGQASPPSGAFVQLSAGFTHTCGLRATGAAVCWGGADELIPSPAGTFTQLSTYDKHACGVRSDGGLTCWGSNGESSENPDGDGRASPPPGTFTQVSVGGSHSCGVGNGGTVTCWGRNAEGQGNPPPGTFVQVSAGWDHTCGLSVDGAVKCWGNNFFGQLGAPPGTFTHLAAGVNHTCGVRSNGRVACWGDDVDRQATPPQGTFTRVSAGFSHTCGVATDNTVRCWGTEGVGKATPPAIPLTQISAGSFHTCGVGIDGTPSCWGFDDDGRASPPMGTFTRVSSGGFHSCGLRTDGRIICWGDNFVGQSSPPLGTFAQVGAGRLHSCGQRLDGLVSCWGFDGNGQTDSPTGTLFTSLGVGQFHSCGVRTNGFVSCWGFDGNGQASPPGETFSAVSAGEAHSCGVRQDGTLSCRGSNGESEANPQGDGRASPPPGLFTQVTTGNSHSCALALDGTATCWGDDYFGETSPPIGNFTQVSAGFLYTCGIRPDQTSECWGSNGYGPITPPADLVAVTSPSSLRLDPTRLFNVSTRGTVAGPGLQAGFIVTGQGRRFAVMGEAIDGPLDARLVLTTFPAGQLIDQNDAWQDHPSAQDLANTLRAPGTARDAAFIANLGVGAYVATLISQDGVVAPGIVSVTALEGPNDTYPLNLSTQGSGAMTAGFIVTGNASRCYVVKAEGVGDFAMTDPALVVRRLDGTIIDANNDWTSHPTANLVQTAGFAPVRATEAALAVRLSEGSYLAELYSMRQSEAQQRAIIAATEVVDDPALSDCDASTPYQPLSVNDIAEVAGDGATLTMELALPTARCVIPGDNYCLAYQATRNVNVRQTVDLIVQAQSSLPGDLLTFDWQLEAGALSEQLARDHLRMRFQNPGNHDVTVTVSSPIAGSVSTTLRIRVLDPDAGGGR